MLGVSANIVPVRVGYRNSVHLTYFAALLINTKTKQLNTKAKQLKAKAKQLKAKTKQLNTKTKDKAAQYKDKDTAA